jgi:hypothetical protein
VVKENADGTFLWTAPDGGQYEFNAGGGGVMSEEVWIEA